MSAIDFKVIFDRSPNPYMLLDRELRYVAANSAYLRVTASRLEDLLGHHVFEQFPNDPEDPDNESAKMLRASFERVLSTGQPDTLAFIPYRVPEHTDSGLTIRLRYWSATNTPILDADGQVAFILQHTVDVSELHGLHGAAKLVEGERGPLLAQVEAGVLGRAEVVQNVNRLLDVERLHLLQLFKEAPGFMCFLRGANHVFELANDAYLRLVGRKDIIGLTVREVLPEVAGQGYFELLDQVFATAEPVIRRGSRISLRRNPHDEPEDRYVDFVYQPIVGADGEVAGLLVQGHDITEQKLAEGALRRSEDRLRRVIESSQTGSWEMDLETGKVSADARLLALFGLPPEAEFDLEVVLGGIHEADRDRVHAAIAAALAGEDEGRYRVEYRTVGAGDGERWVEGRGQAFFDDSGRASRFLGTGIDITERKRAEQERERLLAAESAARKEAEQANQLKDEFLATVSHELRTPLTAMLGWVQMLRSGALPLDKQRRALETIERNARAQAQLIEDLLDVSRILSGKMKLDVEPFAVGTVVEQALESARPAAEAKQIRIQAAIDSTCTVIGDPHRLQQVVWNLLSNAVKFTPKNGRVQVFVERRDSSVDITVADTGQGISPEFLPHVFERFRQADGGTKRKYGGLGLGLSIVHHLVEMHGGTVSVMSEGVGRGTTFIVSLPLSVAQRREVVVSPALRRDTEHAPIECPPQLAGLHVLVVDDETDTRELLRAILEGCAARVSAADSVAKGLELLQSERPDLLISDIGMPGADGYTLIERVRALPRDAGGSTPAIAVTAYARVEDRARALLAGFNSHVPKPVEPVELLAVIASLAGRVGMQS